MFRIMFEILTVKIYNIGDCCRSLVLSCYQSDVVFLQILKTYLKLVKLRFLCLINRAESVSLFTQVKIGIGE